MMLAVQTASGMLYVPASEIASIVPCYPDRVRVVLGDGRVGHRPGRVDSGPWARIGELWLNPRWLVRDGDFWRDPAGFLFPYEDLEEPVFEEPSDLIAVERRGRSWVWRSDSGETSGEKPTPESELRLVRRGLYVNLQRVREFGSMSRAGWLTLDTGERVVVTGDYFHAVADFLGCDSLACLDKELDQKTFHLREYSYDLRSARPARIRQDLPNATIFGEHLLWQLVVRPQDFGGTEEALAELVGTAARRCGYDLSNIALDYLLKDLVLNRGLFSLRQLGLLENQPERRRVGKRYPQVILLAPSDPSKPVSRRTTCQAAERAGVSLLLMGKANQLVLEYLAADVGGPVRLLAWRVSESEARLARQRLQRLGVDSSPLVWLDNLAELGRTVKALPPVLPHSPQCPFQRVILEHLDGLVFVPPEEIAAWSPTRPARWRVILADGRVLHHPGPVPAGPWKRWGEHWVLPQHLTREGKSYLAPSGLRLEGGGVARLAPVALPEPDADPRVWLENRDGLGVWHMLDGSEDPTQLPFVEATHQHGGLAPISELRFVNYNRIQQIESGRNGARPSLRLDDGSVFSLPRGSFAHKLKQVLGLNSFGELGPDRQGARYLALRDYPYEIARAPAERLRADFASSLHLMANVVWQVACGRFSYGDGFMAFFYYPLMATLERAGFDSADKDQLYIQFAAMMTRMVYIYRLFTYHEFGFKDPAPELRVIGDRQPGRILLVEKGERLAEYARQLQAELGISLLICKGMPSLLAAEYFVPELRRHFQGEVEVFFYGDFDEYGWDMGPTFITHLKFYGVACKRLERLVLPSCFSAEELQLHSRVISTPSRESYGRVQRWIREGGGINGEARGIHGNWLQPFERVRARMLEILA